MTFCIVTVKRKIIILKLGKGYKSIDFPVHSPRVPVFSVFGFCGLCLKCSSCFFGIAALCIEAVSMFHCILQSPSCGWKRQKEVARYIKSKAICVTGHEGP